MMNNPFSIQPPRLNRPNRQGLWLNIALAVGLVLLANGLIFSLDWNTNSDPAQQRSTAYEVPGAVVGSVWIGLFTGMAVARWRLNGPALSDQRADNARWWVSVLIINCVLYPAYTLGLNSLYLGLAGNGITLLMAAIGTRVAWPHDRWAAFLVALVGVWVTFASYTIVGQLGWLG